MVATSQPLAATTGLRILMEGGNAADAAVAVAAMLDTAATLAAENAASAVERAWQDRLGDRTLRVLTHSPGYCGWHISGQAPLFAQLSPETIGVRLTDSFLMKPL